MADKIQKTNVARLLDSYHVSYDLIPYEVDESDLSAVHVAKLLNEPIDLVFKTLVLRGDKTGFFVCVIPLFSANKLPHSVYNILEASVLDT